LADTSLVPATMAITLNGSSESVRRPTEIPDVTTVQPTFANADGTAMTLAELNARVVVVKVTMTMMQVELPQACTADHLSNSDYATGLQTTMASILDGVTDDNVTVVRASTNFAQS
jgi:hypothetical protein